MLGPEVVETSLLEPCILLLYAKSIHNNESHFPFLNKILKAHPSFQISLAGASYSPCDRRDRPTSALPTNRTRNSDRCKTLYSGYSHFWKSEDCGAVAFRVGNWAPYLHPEECLPSPSFHSVGQSNGSDATASSHCGALDGQLSFEGAPMPGSPWARRRGTQIALQHGFRRVLALPRHTVSVSVGTPRFTFPNDPRKVYGDDQCLSTPATI